MESPSPLIVAVVGFLDIPRSVVDELEEHQLRVCVCTQQSLEHPTKLRSTSLLDFILEKFEEIDTEQIICLATDFGGFVLKEALVVAQTSAKYKDILGALKSLVFFGTPHCETSQQTWSLTLTRLVAHFKEEIKGHTAPELLLGQILLSCSKIAHDFKLIANKYRILQFDQDTGAPNLIFEPELVPTGSPNEEIILANVEYNGLVYLLNRKLYRDRLLNLQRESFEVTKPRYCSFIDTLRMLSPQSLDPAHEASSFDKTAAVLLSQERIKVWLRSDSSSALALEVPPGFHNDEFIYSLKRHVSEIRYDGLQIYTILSANLAGFSASHRQSIPTIVLSHLIYQAIQQSPSLWQSVESLFSEEELASIFLGKMACLQEPLLWRCLTALISANKQIMCLFLDQPFQHKKDDSQPFLNHLISLTKLIDCTFKIMVVHRSGQYVPLEDTAFTSTLDISNGEVQNAIKGDLQDVLASLQKQQPGTVEIHEFVKRAIPEFYAAPLELATYIRSLETRRVVTQASLEDSLRLISKPIILFQTILLDVPDSEKEFIRNLLMVVASARRPLSKAETSAAIALVMVGDKNGQDIGGIQNLTPIDIQHSISTYLTGLVGVDRCNNIRLLHADLAEFLSSTRSSSTDWYRSPSPPHFTMTQLCLRCITIFLRACNPLARQIVMPLLNYAELNWPLHILQAVADGLTDDEFAGITELMNDETINEWTRLRTQLWYHGIFEAPQSQFPQLSPLALRRDHGLEVGPAVAVSIVALESLAAVNWSEDLALVWGLSNAVGSTYAAQYWHQNSKASPEDLLDLFGLDPCLAFHLLKAVNETFVAQNLAQILSLSMKYGSNVVWDYITHQQPVSRDSIELQVHEDVLYLVQSHSGNGGNWPLYNQKSLVAALGLAEFFQCAQGSIDSLFSDAGTEVGLATIHAAVVSNNKVAMEALISVCSGILETLAHAIGDASKLGYFGVLETLLPKAKEADIRSPNAEGSTPLHMASRQGFARIVDMLLKHGASCSVADNMGATPLLFAVQSGNLATVQCLLNDTVRQIDPKVDRGSLTLLMPAIMYGFEHIAHFLVEQASELETTGGLGRVMCLAAQHGFARLLQQLSSQICKLDKESVKQEVRRAITYAASKGFLDFLSTLLDIFGFPNSTTTADARLLEHASEYLPVLSLLLKYHPPQQCLSEALLNLAYSGRLKGAELLLDAGADKNYQDSYQSTALQLAAYGGHRDVVELLLLRRADMEAKDPKGRTALFEAVQEGRKSTVKLLLDAGADVYTTDTSCRGPFDRAVESGNEDIMLLLLTKMRSQKQDSDKVVMTERELLKSMITNGFLKVVEFLLANRQTPSDLVTELNLAIQKRYLGDTDEGVSDKARSDALDLVRLLLRYGADPNGGPTDESSPPIHLVASHCDIQLAELLLGGTKPGARADVNKTGGQLWSALYACVSGDTTSDQKKMAMFDFLVRNGVDLTDSRGPKGTVIHKASISRSCSMPFVEHILRHSGDKLTLYTRDPEGRIPAHYVAAIGGSRRTRELFLRPDFLTIKDKQGRTPVHMRAAGGFTVSLRSIAKELTAEMLSETDTDGWNVLHWVCRQRDKLTVLQMRKLIAEADPELLPKLCVAKENIFGWLPTDVAFAHGNARYLEVFWGHFSHPNRTQKSECNCDPNGTMAFQELPATASTCNSCFCRIYGTRHQCQECFKFELCFKCFTHVDQIHDNTHQFRNISVLPKYNNWLDHIDLFNKSIGIKDQVLGQAIKVAVIDDGVDVLHDEFLKHNSVVDGWSKSYDPLTGTPDSWSASGSGHGTTMARMILRVHPGARIFPMRLRSSVKSGGAPHFSFNLRFLTMAVKEAVSSKVDIISISFTVAQPTEEEEIKNLELALEEATKSGILVFCSANDWETRLETRLPADLATDCVIRIGAANSGGPSSHSENDPRKMDFLLPGPNIPDRDTNLHRRGGGTPEDFRGATESSVSTALASGLAALMLHCANITVMHRCKTEDEEAAMKEQCLKLRRPDEMRRVFERIGLNRHGFDEVWELLEIAVACFEMRPDKTKQHIAGVIWPRYLCPSS